MIVHGNILERFVPVEFFGEIFCSRAKIVKIANFRRKVLILN